MSRPDASALLENHLAFSAWHRGRVLRAPHAIRIESELPGFRCLLPLTPEAGARLSDYDTARLLPWTRIAESALAENGYAQSGGLVYMVLRELRRSISSAEVGIERISDRPGMDAFTRVQAAGFLDGDRGEEFETWRKRLGERNHANLGHPRQVFYLARHRGHPAGVTLLLETDRIAGIYAVATLPECRKRGVSTALLARAVADARERGCAAVSLQAVQGSYAEAFYRRLGFETAFESPVFARRAAE
jgi:GNAT superfamily N-acetyltransferase